MATSPADFNAQVIAEFRANGGQVGGTLAGMPVLLLHHTGAQSGKEYVNPLAYLEDDGRYAIFASAAGAPKHPGWFHNLKAHPDVSIEVGTQTLEVHAQEATGEDRDRLYKNQSERMPQFSEYEQKTDRLIPVVLLQPAGSA